MVRYELMTSSDHNALILFLCKDAQQHTYVFRFCNEGKDKAKCGELICQQWMLETETPIALKLHSLSAALHQWNRRYKDDFQ